MTDGPPQGLRYTHAYIERGAPGPITPTARSRLAALVIALPEPRDLEREIEREMGLLVFDWRLFFAKQISDEQLLDLITVIRKWLVKKVQSSLYFPDRAAPIDWVDDVNRIFRQENIRYHVDPVGGVHPYVDEEFQRNRTSTIATLSRARYANVARNFQEAHDHLSAVPAEGKKAIGATFAAAEGLFRLMFWSEPRLTADAVRQNLPLLLQRLYDDNAPALRAASKLLRSFSEWIEAAHFYRHEPGTKEVVEPPLELAVNLVSVGASFLRWLKELDEQKPAPRTKTRTRRP